jgi:golgi phosphoprotein 3
MLLAEELLLISLDEESGGQGMTENLNAGLAGAVLLDLAAAGAIEVQDEKIVAVGEAPAGAPATALEAIRAQERPRNAKHWVGRLPRALKPIRATVAEPLVQQGVLADEKRKLLGLFPSRRFPERNPEPERALRARIRAVLLDGEEPGPQTAQLIGLLQPLGLIGRVVKGSEGRAAKRRAKELGDRGVVGNAVERAVQEELVAVYVAIGAAVTTSASSN